MYVTTMLGFIAVNIAFAVTVIATGSFGAPFPNARGALPPFEMIAALSLVFAFAGVMALVWKPEVGDRAGNVCAAFVWFTILAMASLRLAGVELWT